jgi:HEPN domain-containing protein
MRALTSRGRGDQPYLKALLQDQGVAFPRTHDLEGLRALLKPHQVSLLRFRRRLRDRDIRRVFNGEAGEKLQPPGSLRPPMNRGLTVGH